MWFEPFKARKEGKLTSATSKESKESKDSGKRDHKILSNERF